MHKQFEIMSQMKEKYDEGIERLRKMRLDVQALEYAIQNEIDVIWEPLLDSYPHEQEIMYLACFPSSSVIELYRVSLARVEYILLSWYHLEREPYVCPKEDEPREVPKTEEDMRTLLNSYYAPTRVRMDCYKTFGYFYDIKGTYTRKDWILEKLRKGETPYEIQKEDFIRAIQVVHDTYSRWCNEDIAPECSPSLLASS